MPTDGRTQTYGFLDQLSTEQLLNLLRADFDSSEDGDDEQIFQILEVIEKRERERAPDSLPDAAQAWEDFQTYFNTPDGTGRSLYPMRDSAGKSAAGTARRRRRPLKRLLPLSATVAALTVSCMVTAQAIGFDIFGALAQWTAETFRFEMGAADPASEALRQAVQGTFDECGVMIPAPIWYPEGSMLARDISVSKDTEASVILCGFTCGDQSFFIEVQQYYQNDRIPSYTLEKDAAEVEEYSSNGRLFYIMSNLSSSRAVYSSDQTIMVINGDLSLETLKQIIDSIGE